MNNEDLGAEKADFYVPMVQAGDKSVVLARGKFSETCIFCFECDLKKMIKEGYEFECNILVPATQLFNRFDDDGEIDSFFETGFYFASVYQNRKLKRSIWCLNGSKTMKSDAVYNMVQKGPGMQEYGFCFSRLTNVRGMPWYNGLEVYAAPREKEKRWCLTLSYYYPDESYRNTIETDVKIFEDKDVAIGCLKETIRSTWTSEVDTDDGVKMLADCQGMSEYDGSKYSSWLYSEDGCLAWCFYDDGHGYKGEISEIEV